MLSTKPDVFQATLTRRGRLGRVWLFDPFGEQSSAWTPIQGCENWNRALMTAEWLGDAANEGHTSEAGHFWRGEAATLLAPLLYAAALSGADMPQVLHWLHDRSVKEVLDILDTDHTQGAAAAAQFEGKHAEDDRNRATTYMSATALLKAYRFPRLQAYTQRDDLTTDAFLNGKPNTVYIIAPEHQQELLRPIIVALVSQLYVAAVEKANTGNARAANTAGTHPCASSSTRPPTSPPPTLAQLPGPKPRPRDPLRHRLARPQPAPRTLRTRRRRIRPLQLLRQTLPRPHLRRHTLRYLEQLLGDVALPHHNITQSGDWGDHRSTTEVTHYRPVATAPELRQIQHDRGLLLCERIPPALIALRPWYDDAALQKLAA